MSKQTKYKVGKLTLNPKMLKKYNPDFPRSYSEKEYFNMIVTAIENKIDDLMYYDVCAFSATNKYPHEYRVGSLISVDNKYLFKVTGGCPLEDNGFVHTIIYHVEQVDDMIIDKDFNVECTIKFN